jgi:PAS domain S-box-containing protein
MQESHGVPDAPAGEIDRLRSRVAELEALLTKRTGAEEALRHLRGVHEDIAQHVAEGIVLEEAHGRLTYVNPAAATLLGYSPEELIGHSWTLIVPPECQAIVRDADQRRTHGLVDRYEIEVVRKDGSRVPVMVSGGPRYEDGAFAGTLAVLSDISELKEAEAEIRARTLQLEAANRELEAFSYSVSHDLRAPLRAMDGFSRILLEEYAEQLPEKAAHFLRRIRDNAEQMGRLIDDLLAFSRLSRTPLARKQVSLGELAREAFEGLGPERGSRRVELVLGTFPPCSADPALLKQVLVNLLANALKFTRSRDVPRIEVGCQRTRGQLTCYVKDNGVGFDMNYADKLFGVFQRLHRAEEYEGTGVGLAVVQRIIHRHGGRVWADAEADKGATFYFTLGERSPDE